MPLDNKIYLITTIKRESDHTKENAYQNYIPLFNSTVSMQIKT